LSTQAAENDLVLLRVVDTGIGMSPEDLPTAMAPFGQIDSELSRRHEGTGLGLPLTKALVELHGGRIAIDSERGKGTSVTLTLPHGVRSTAIPQSSALLAVG
jgi:two-component system cell cycle sensor histidine kinase PleC